MEEVCVFVLIWVHTVLIDSAGRHLLPSCHPLSNSTVYAILTPP